MFIIRITILIVLQFNTIYAADALSQLNDQLASDMADIKVIINVLFAFTLMYWFKDAILTGFAKAQWFEFGGVLFKIFASMAALNAILTVMF